jgi:hypothetical protein
MGGKEVCFHCHQRQRQEVLPYNVTDMYRLARAGGFHPLAAPATVEGVAKENIGQTVHAFACQYSKDDENCHKLVALMATITCKAREEQLLEIACS